MTVFPAADAGATQALGAALAQALVQSLEGAVVYLCGELGAGKTTFVRGVLRGLGYTGAVRSPTYTLVEGYETCGRMLYHLDLYRIADPVELEFLGVRELDAPEHWVFIEWPERGEGRLPRPDLELGFTVSGSGRRVKSSPATVKGEALLGLWQGRAVGQNASQRAQKPGV